MATYLHIINITGVTTTAGAQAATTYSSILNSADTRYSYFCSLYANPGGTTCTVSATNLIRTFWLAGTCPTKIVAQYTAATTVGYVLLVSHPNMLPVMIDFYFNGTGTRQTKSIGINITDDDIDGSILTSILSQKDLFEYINNVDERYSFPNKERIFCNSWGKGITKGKWLRQNFYRNSNTVSTSCLNDYMLGNENFEYVQFNSLACSADSEKYIKNVLYCPCELPRAAKSGINAFSGKTQLLQDISDGGSNTTNYVSLTINQYNYGKASATTAIHEVAWFGYLVTVSNPFKILMGRRFLVNTATTNISFTSAYTPEISSSSYTNSALNMKAFYRTNIKGTASDGQQNPWGNWREAEISSTNIKTVSGRRYISATISMSGCTTVTSGVAISFRAILLEDEYKPKILDNNQLLFNFEILDQSENRLSQTSINSLLPPNYFEKVYSISTGGSAEQKIFFYRTNLTPLNLYYRYSTPFGVTVESSVTLSENVVIDILGEVNDLEGRPMQFHFTATGTSYSVSFVCNSKTITTATLSNPRAYDGSRYHYYYTLDAPIYEWCKIYLVINGSNKGWVYYENKMVDIDVVAGGCPSNSLCSGEVANIYPTSFSTYSPCDFGGSTAYQRYKCVFDCFNNCNDSTCTQFDCTIDGTCGILDCTSDSCTRN